MMPALYTDEQMYNEIIRFYHARGEKVPPLNLPRLLFYIHAMFLVHEGEAQFETTLKIGQYGPSPNIILGNFYNIGDHSDSCPNEKLTFQEAESGWAFELNPPLVPDGRHRALIHDLLASYSRYSPFDLIKKVQEEKPWHGHLIEVNEPHADSPYTWLDFKPYKTVSDVVIKRYYEQYPDQLKGS